MEAKEKAHIDPNSGDTIYIDPETNRRVLAPTVLTIDTKKELEQQILDRNRNHFAQAKNTPWHQPPLNNIGRHNNFNLFKIKDKATIELPENTFMETKLILEMLQAEQLNNKLKWSSTITFEDFISGLEHWAEKTSTSRSGRHLGIYKSLITAYKNKGNEFNSKDVNNRTIQEKAEDILHIIHGLAHTAVTYGFYLKRWESVVEIMMYKIQGCIELEQLQIIHLFEADFNLIIGILFGRRSMHHQTDHKFLYPGQYGKPGRECQDAAYAKLLHYHISRYTGTDMSCFESDAAACFDRIVMAFAL